MCVCVLQCHYSVKFMSQLEHSVTDGTFPKHVSDWMLHYPNLCDEVLVSRKFNMKMAFVNDVINFFNDYICHSDYSNVNNTYPILVEFHPKLYDFVPFILIPPSIYYHGFMSASDISQYQVRNLFTGYLICAVHVKQSYGVLLI